MIKCENISNILHSRTCRNLRDPTLKLSLCFHLSPAHRSIVYIVVNDKIKKTASFIWATKRSETDKPGTGFRSSVGNLKLARSLSPEYQTIRIYRNLRAYKRCKLWRLVCVIGPWAYYVVIWRGWDLHKCTANFCSWACNRCFGCEDMKIRFWPQILVRVHKVYNTWMRSRQSHKNVTFTY